MKKSLMWIFITISFFYNQGCENPVENTYDSLQGPKITFTINGAGYNDKTFQYSIDKNSGKIEYSQEDVRISPQKVESFEWLRCIAKPSNSTGSSVSLSIPGIEVGVYEWDEDDRIYNMIMITLTSYIFLGIEGQTEITKIGGHGDFVEGKFSGKFKRLGAYDSGKMVDISGKFMLVLDNPAN